MHPYTNYENNEIWRVVEKSILDLIENQDIEITTKEEYVIGYITQQVMKEIEKENDFEPKT